MNKKIKQTKYIENSQYTKPAFTLAEMMVVLLVVSILVAAFLPIITRRTMKQKVSGSLWEYSTFSPKDIHPTSGGRVAIGSTTTDAHSWLLLNTKSAAQYPIIFEQGTNAPSVTGHLAIDANNNVALGQSINDSATNASNLAIGNNINLAPYGKSTLIGNLLTANNSAPNLGPVLIGHSIDDFMDNAIAIGNNLTRGGQSSDIVVIGNGAEATDEPSVAIGTTDFGTSNNTSARGRNAITIGTAAKTDDDEGVAIGSYAYATGFNTLAIGSGASYGEADETKNDRAPLAYGQNSVAIGAGARTLTSNSMSIGHNAVSGRPGEYSIAIGQNTVSGTKSTAIGNGAKATGTSSIAIGDGAQATADNATAIGYGAQAYYPGSTAIGWGAETSYAEHGGYSQMVLGRDVDSIYMQDAVIQGTTVALYSDRRLKDIKGPSKAGLEQIRKLKSYHYTFKADKHNTPQVGVIAQDLQKVFPNAVTKGKDGYLRIRQEDMFYAMINSVKQLDVMTQDLIKKFKSLLSSIKQLDNKIANLVNLDNLSDKKISELDARRIKLEERVNKLEKLAKNSK